MHAIRDLLARSTVSAGVLTVLLLSVVVLLQYTMENRESRAAQVAGGVSDIPDARYLKPVLIGYDAVAADVLWLRAVQVLGQKEVSDKDFEWLYHSLDIITTLDPRYTYAYRVGGVILTELAHRPDLSNRLLEKGCAQTPTAWWLPFNLAYNHFFYLNDHERGAEYMAKAARLPGSPPYLPRLAARMYAEAGTPQIGISFLEAMIGQVGEPHVKEALQQRLTDLVIERDIKVLEDAVMTYRDRARRSPKDFEDLIAAGVLQTLPRAPQDTEFRLDQKTGRVSANTRPNRMQVYRP